MKILVTGGAGFIGSHLCDSLVKHDWQITILDNFSAGSRDNLRHLLMQRPKKVKLIEGDCTNPTHVKKALRGVETVFHFAANPEVRLELNDPQTCFRHSVYATHVLLQQIEHNRKICTLVFLSTSTVYGEAETIPTPESYGPLKPISPAFQTTITTGACSIMLHDEKDDPMLPMPIFLGIPSNSCLNRSVSACLASPMSTVNRHC